MQELKKIFQKLGENIWGVVIVVVATALVVGLPIYFWQRVEVSQLRSEIENFKSELEKTQREARAIKTENRDVSSALEHFKEFNERLQNGQTELANVEWFWYENEDLGFKMKYPKEAGSYQPKAIEDGNIVYFTSNKYTENEAMEAVSSGASEYEKINGRPWSMLIKDVKNEEEVEFFTKEVYGNDCEFEGVEKAEEMEGLYRVKIRGGGTESDCFLNYAFVIFYSPEKGRIATWSIGQAPSFFIGENRIAVDRVMRESFEFL